jgi:hypothetical protein
MLRHYDTDFLLKHDAEISKFFSTQESSLVFAKLPHHRDYAGS